MNITGKDRKDCAPASCFHSAFVVSSQAKSTRRVGHQCQSSRLSGLSVSSSSLQFLRSERPVLAALHGSIISRGATQDVGNIVQERGFFTQAHFAGSYLNV